MRRETQRIEFAAKTIAKLPVPKSGRDRIHYYDEHTDGLGLRVESTGRKSFFWFRKVNGDPTFRMLGDFPSTTAEAARGDAEGLNSKLTRFKLDKYVWRQEGDNPFEKKKTEARAPVPKFRELVEAYIEHHVKKEANHPVQAEYHVRWKVKKHCEAWLDRKLDSITIEDVLAVKRACGKRGYLANRAIEFIRAIFNWSSETKERRVNFYRAENPAEDVELHEEKKRERFLQPEELVTFNDALQKEKHVDLKDFLVLAMNTGARRADIFSMRWQDIQWERSVWKVPYPKNGESYDVQLLRTAIEVLKRRRTEIADSVPFVFPGVGKTKHLVELKKPWNEFRRTAGIPDVRIHDLRRTCGSYQAIAGVSLQQIGASLGHKSMQSTLIYAKLHSEAVRDGRETGQKKMLSMMRAAQKRQKLVARKQRLLKAASNG